MLPSQLNNSPRRVNPFARSSPSPGSPSQTRPKSAVITPSNGLEPAKGHLRNSSVSQISPGLSTASATRGRSNSARNNTLSGTFAPSFIKSEELRRGADQIRGLEGDNDFSGNRYVWLRDPQKAFVRGLVLEELVGGRLLVQSDDGDVGIFCLWTHALKTDIWSSNKKWRRIRSTRSIQPSLIRRTTWPSSHI